MTARPVHREWPMTPPSVTPSQFCKGIKGVAKTIHWTFKPSYSLTCAAAMAIVAIWLRSPHSARNVSVNACEGAPAATTVAT